MFVEQLRQAISAAPRLELPKVSALLWKAYAAGSVTEGQATELSDLIEAHKALPAPEKPVPRRVGSRPRTPASMARRRSWAASGLLPPQVQCRFTLAEAAALAVIAVEVKKRGTCQLTIGEIAGTAGVSETTVRNALREARALGLVAVEERRRTAWMNYPNRVQIVSKEWGAWLRLHGFKFVKPTPTQIQNSLALTRENTPVRPPAAARSQNLNPLNPSQPSQEAAGRQRAEAAARSEILTRGGKGRGGGMS